MCIRDRYSVINRCNFLLDRVDAVRKNTTDDNDLDQIDQCCGEAYFARALAYSELVKCFCKAYESDAEAANELGVILTRHYQEMCIRDRSQLCHRIGTNISVGCLIEPLFL